MNVSPVLKQLAISFWRKAVNLWVLRFTWLLPKVSPTQIHVTNYVLTLNAWDAPTGNSPKKNKSASCMIHPKEHATSLVVQKSQAWSLA